MDVVSGEFAFDVAERRVVSASGAPRKAYLDPEIADEGTKVLLSDGTAVTWNPPPAKPNIPDISNVKSIRHYFNRTDYHFFPTWLYHPTEEPKIAKNAEEAWDKFGIRLKESTDMEKRQFGAGKYRWEMTMEWSTRPYHVEKFDPNNAGHGKNYMPSTPNPLMAQNALIAELIPTVTAAVVSALKGSGQANAPAAVDQSEWDEFLAFQAWKKTQEALQPTDDPDAAERCEWEAKAKEANIKIDGRWSLERLRREVMSELEKRVRAAEQPSETPGEAA